MIYDTSLVFFCALPSDFAIISSEAHGSINVRWFIAACFADF